ncbi:MAG: S66 peptidase family protein [Liquorilactobacillus nagelii]|uniref:S66 family peptidase n=1 Tax=Liquorilactobacillus nagelii TaxID=82688 RepID=UPI0039E92234
MNIGYYSASTPITALSPKRFHRAVDFLQQEGVKLTAGCLTGKQDDYRSGSIFERAQEINQLIHNNQVEIIMATIGGTNTNSVLPYIDYAYLKQHPKTFVGYSDATALLLAVKTQVPQCRVLYGPALVASFGEWQPFVGMTWRYFKQILSASSNQVVRLNAPDFWSDEHLNWENFERPKEQCANAWHYTCQPVLEGRLIGGNLNTMSGIIGSKFFPNLSAEDILLIEDAEKDAATVEKNFAMLKNAGVFDKIKGIILGKHALFDDLGSHKTPIEILLEVVNNPQLPIIYDYDCCHTVPMLTTPLGARVLINARTMTIEFADF